MKKPKEIVRNVERGIAKVTPENGKPYYRIRIDRTHKLYPHLRVQKEGKTEEGIPKARLLKQRLLAEAIRELELKTKRSESWEACLDEWSAYVHARNLVSSNIEAGARLRDTQSLLVKYTGAWRLRPIAEITTLDVGELLDQMRREGLSESRARAVRSALNRVFRWAIASRLLPAHHPLPTVGLEAPPRKPERVPPILKLDSLRMFLQAAKLSGIEWYPVWAMAAGTGMRSGELYALRWEDVDLDNNLIHVRRSFSFRVKKEKGTKSGYVRQVPINSELRELLLELKRKAGATQSVLPRLPRWTHGETSRHVKVFCKSIGITPVTFHTLRACFATHMLQSGVPMPTVKAICGWKDTKTMDIYLRVAGVDIKGATANLKLLPTEAAMANVTPLFSKNPLPS